MSRYPLIYLFNSDCTVRVPFVIAPAFRSASFQSPLEVRGLGLQSNFRSDQRKWGVGEKKVSLSNKGSGNVIKKLNTYPPFFLLSNRLQSSSRLLCLGASLRKWGGFVCLALARVSLWVTSAARALAFAAESVLRLF